MRIRPISISLSPNVERDDLLTALKLLCTPWNWTRGFRQNPSEEIERACADFLGLREAAAFNSGRAALMAVLQALELPEGSGVFLQAFTCNAVPNPVQWAGLKPVFVDCREEDYNMDPGDLERKIEKFLAEGKVPGAVVVQHTFGIPADTDAILRVCNKFKIAMVEDCAHSLGSAGADGRLTGTAGRIAVLSFSRDKVISCVYGGAAVTDDPSLARRLREIRDSAGYPSACWTVQQILHPLFLHLLILPAYRVLGKYLLFLFQRLHVLSKAVSAKEKRGERPAAFPHRLPRALAVLAIRQMRKLDRFTARRRELAERYRTELSGTAFVLPIAPEGSSPVFLRFPVRRLGAQNIIRDGRKRGILLGDWYTSPVDPGDTVLAAVGYERGSCPRAESIAGEVINLPTCITIGPREEEEVIAFLRFYES